MGSSTAIHVILHSRMPWYACLHATPHTNPTAHQGLQMHALKQVALIIKRAPPPVKAIQWNHQTGIGCRRTQHRWSATSGVQPTSPADVSASTATASRNGERRNGAHLPACFTRVHVLQCCDAALCWSIMQNGAWHPSVVLLGTMLPRGDRGQAGVSVGRVGGDERGLCFVHNLLATMVWLPQAMHCC
eukprot:363978-Chlamydomonas_euryale.AAC.6